MHKDLVIREGRLNEDLAFPFLSLVGSRTVLLISTGFISGELAGGGSQ